MPCPTGRELAHSFWMIPMIELTLTLQINFRSSTTTWIRLMIICINSCTSKTQQNKRLKSTGTLPMCQLWVRRVGSITYPFGIKPSRKSQPMTPIPMFANISPQTIYIYTLRWGARTALVCLIAFQRVRQPKPSVNPAAALANVKSPTLDDILKTIVWIRE